MYIRGPHYIAGLISKYSIHIIMTKTQQCMCGMWFDLPEHLIFDTSK